MGTDRVEKTRGKDEREEVLKGEKGVRPGMEDSSYLPARLIPPDKLAVLSPSHSFSHYI